MRLSVATTSVPGDLFSKLLTPCQARQSQSVQVRPLVETIKGLTFSNWILVILTVAY